MSQERRILFNGIYSEAAILRTILPTDCPEKRGFTCGVISLVFSKTLLDFFEIKDGLEKERQIRLSVLANNNDSLALAIVLAETEGVRATFRIRSLNLKSEDGTIQNRERKLRVRKQFSDGRSRVEEIIGLDKNYSAYKEIINLWKGRTIQKTQSRLLCRTCPAQENGLPGTIV